MDPLKTHLDIAKIINKQLLGTILNDEAILLSQWRSQQENEALYQEIRTNVISGKYKKALEDFDVDAGWGKNEKRLNTQFKRVVLNKAMRIAAVITLMLAVGSIVYYLVQTSVQDKIQVADSTIVPGKAQAELILADGSVVNLSAKEQVINEQGLQIKTNKGVVAYQAPTKPILVAALNTLKVPLGGEYQITLPDGTKVWLNSVSELRYPISFNGSQRKVYLKGEAYFEVNHDAKHPFVVSTEGGMEVKVLGTSFNMMTYDDETHMETTLVEGSVEVNLSNNESVKIMPGEQASFNKSAMSVTVKEVNTDAHIAWVNGRFVFEKEELESILKKLGRWYDIDVFYQNESVKNRRFSADLRRYEDITSFLDLFAQVSTVDFEINGKTILVKER